MCRDRREVNATQITTKQRCLVRNRCSQLCIATRVMQRKCKARREKCQDTRHEPSSAAGGALGGMRTEDWLAEQFIDLSGAHGCSARKKVPAHRRMRDTVRATNHRGILTVIVDNTRGAQAGIC
ncbi:hypothetical protein TRVL_07111 [Trypanosoma vivax]|nr:hypothetical protein TRVL_07111 [Trypanosoma vivax]